MTDKLTLYMIGHAPDAHYLKRLLEQLKPIIKGVSFVVTDDKPDCEQVLKDSGIPYTLGSYIPESRQAFNFSKARNQAMLAAEKRFGGWLVWFDCDDTIANPTRILEQMEANPGQDAYGLPYDVSPCQSNLFKLRIHRAEGWEWKNRVHEELVPTAGQSKFLVLSDCVVKHAPDEGKSNHLFHIELLKDSCKNAPNEYAYIAKELLNLGHWADCIEWCDKVIAVHPIEVEIFRAHLNKGICCMKLGRYEDAIKFLREASRVYPWRREPYFFLAEMMGTMGTAWKKQGYAYIAACNAMPDYEEPGQNAIIYDCAGYKLHARYLISMGEPEQAHRVMLRAKVLDDEAREIILEIEGLLKDKALAERAA